MIRRVLACLVLSVILQIGMSVASQADTAAGTLITLSSDAKTITIKEGAQTQKLIMTDQTKVLRGQVGKTLQEIAPNELALGDRILATIDSGKNVTTVRASYTIVAGTVERTVDRKIVLKPEKAVFLHPNAQIALASGKIGTMQDIKPGSFVICRLEPLSKECWTVVVSQAQSSVAPAKLIETAATKSDSSDSSTKNTLEPVIESITARPSPNLKTGDYVTVEIKGTPGAIVKAQIQDFAGPVQLKEIQTGIYQATFPIRTKEVVPEAVISGYVKLGEKISQPLRVADSFTINLPGSEKMPSPVEVPKVELTPEQQEPIQPVEPEKTVHPTEQTVPEEPVIAPEPPQPVAIAPLTITSPVNFTIVEENIIVAGTGEPDNKVLVQIDYTNGLSGILNITGQVTSQLIAIKSDGSFVYGPLPLTGIFSTKGLQYTVSVKYPEHPEKQIEARRFFGPR